ncbi:metallophosphoesterase family protein [Methylococcus geothermalis]|uniref:Phosphoesterase n=1 Tax=Methylococcus geothermalis TaxID=2681310 RepID=A0A858QAS0_9GAMM|nr:metallophosphoesterase family protein [Methylococcus geothermalis]QJD30776.1 YfcE family phosphodiesterase [Methylococcus geothermalis]
MKRIGFIADTHGLLRPEAVALLEGSDLIVHAGDIGHPGILDRLRELAPVVAVRGNNDRGAWAENLPETAVAECAGLACYVLHDLRMLAIDPVAEGFGVVVSGHSHRAKIRESGGVLYLNPGSAGPRRFKLPVSVAIIDIVSGQPSARIEGIGV